MFYHLQGSGVSPETPEERDIYEQGCKDALEIRRKVNKRFWIEVILGVILPFLMFGVLVIVMLFSI